jgi:hypothetical protein
MKLLILLAFVSTFKAQAQVDLPEGPLGNTEIIQSIWQLHSSNNLDPVLFNVYKDLLLIESLNQIDRLKLLEVTASFSSNKGNSSIFIENLTHIEALQLASSITSISNVSVSLSDLAMDSVVKAKQKISNASLPNDLSSKDIRELLVNTPDLAYYNNGEYKNSLNLFLICRENRNYACRFVLKNIYGDFVTNADGTLWSIPALAKSAKNIPFNKTNGQTPTGVHSIDSVMPEANRQVSFGKFRRLMLDWIPKSKNDMNTKMFLPHSQHSSRWWKRASIARDVGRLYLRIHGTGKINSNKKSTWYPHMPTSGCISTREGKYVSEKYMDQRVILDRMMRASQMSPVYSNEVKLKGALWVFNIDNKLSPVSIKEIENILEL